LPSATGPGRNLWFLLGHATGLLAYATEVNSLQTEPIPTSGVTVPAYARAKTKKAVKSASAGKQNALSKAASVNADVVLEVDTHAVPAADGAATERKRHQRIDGENEVKRMEAVREFTEAYNQLMDELRQSTEPDTFEGFSYGKIAEALREAVYRPIYLNGQATTANKRRISLYEIGVAHSPNYPVAGSAASHLIVHEKKLQAALEDRETDIKALFSGSGDGLPARLAAILQAFIVNKDAWAGDSPNGDLTYERIVSNQCASESSVQFYTDTFLKQCEALSAAFYTRERKLL
jgi:hypothetical protein